MKKLHLAGIAIAAIVLVTSFTVLVLLSGRPAETTPLRYTYEVVAVYPHDNSAFTEGLAIEDSVLYESTGLYGNSTLCRIELDSGKILQTCSLPNQYFGEGITIFGDTIIQLTWQSHKGFVYNKENFDLLREFTYQTEGWGITNNGSALIMSDGTATLYFLDPETFETIGQINVHDDTGSVANLNELEYIHGQVYANIWHEERIAVINPQTGQVNAWIDLSGICNQENQGADNVLNGIAYDTEGDRLFVTGKMWSQLFQVKLIALK
jgi:glutamine cyclotransferase